MAHDVFISHSSKDKIAADAICHALERNGVKCWIAPRDVRPGVEYAEELMNGVENCKIFLLIFSKDSNDSGPVAKEVESAFRYGKTVIPFRIEDVAMRKSLEYYLSNLHWLDAFPDDKEFDSLVRAVKNSLGISSTPSPEAAPAPVPEYPQQNAPVQAPAKKPSKGLIIGIAGAIITIVVAALVMTLLTVLDNNSSNGGNRSGGAVVDSDIVGVWDLIDCTVFERADGSFYDPWGDEQPTVEFKNDGTFSLTNISEPYSGTYAISGNKITFIALGDVWTSEFTISRNTLTFVTDYNGVEFTEVFERVR
ncbi:MAG: TIR domain-containing protein [Oscillospiraceae bacterium]|nr:TIR domain-containing protein [Oscillospiraceae bacterium]